jgi:hypothetical protein
MQEVSGSIPLTSTTRMQLQQKQHAAARSMAAGRRNTVPIV